MGIRANLDVSAYLVIGPENTLGRPVGQVVSLALEAGFTCVQVRSKVCSARELIGCAAEAAQAIADAGKADEVALLVDDRLDAALAARDAGIKVDGVHVGQSDIPVGVCRRYLGEDAVVGLSADTKDAMSCVRNTDVSAIDYFGVGPLRDTATKRDLAVDDCGNVLVQTVDGLRDLAAASPVPVVVGGGVKPADVGALAAAGLDGFFVVSAVCGADDPYAAARELVEGWRAGLRGV